MHHFYRDYYWKKGKPRGLEKLDKDALSDKSFRIVADPYQKWITIEEYKLNKFFQIVYDSRFLDFRHLKPIDQIAWRKESIDSRSSWIYNEDDRLLYKEVSEFIQGICVTSNIFSPYGTLLCQIKMFSFSLKHSFNGIVLYDRNAHPVFMRRYKKCQEGAYVDLEEEKWDMENFHIP